MNTNEIVKSNDIDKIINKNHHLLNSTWVFWYASRKESDHQIPYDLRLKEVAEFSTIEDFFHNYLYLKPASDMNRDIDVSIFKKGYKPLWENCPDSGSWFIRFNKNEDKAEIDLKWEKLIFALIGKKDLTLRRTI